jgi:hypothetical protein
MEISSTSARRWSVLVLAALLGLAMTFATTTASSARSGDAVAAKKKCKKKKGKKSAAAAKKKKCKKKKQQPQPPAQPVAPPAPQALVRATLSWTSDNDVDLHAFDSTGNHAGYGTGGQIENTIPNSSFSGDVQTAGSESFTDNIFVPGGPSNREFAYVACLWNVDNADINYTVTFTGVARDGSTVTRTLQGTPSNGPDAIPIPMPGGPTVPDPDETCNFPL